jgi:hypothetical protein
VSKFVEVEQGPVEEDASGRGTLGAVGELGFSTGGRAAPAGVPAPELAEKARRRRFSAKYKLAIVREADGCERPGEIGALLRRELDRSRSDLQTARRVIEVQGNVSALLEELLTKSATETDERRPQR